MGGRNEEPVMRDGAPALQVRLLQQSSLSYLALVAAAARLAATPHAGEASGGHGHTGEQHRLNQGKWRAFIGFIVEVAFPS